MKPGNCFIALAIVASLASVAVAGAQEPPAGTQPPPATATQPPPAEAAPPPATTPPPAEATQPPAAAQAAPAAAAADATGPDSRIDAVKQSLASSAEVLKGYEWSQNVALSLKGEEKAHKNFKCSYGADGKIQKAPVAPAGEEPKKKKGLRGKVAENKKEDMEAALKASMALIDQYSPLEAGRVQTAKSTGNVSVSVPGADNRVRITINNYLKPGDMVELEMDGAKNTLQSVSITSAMDGEVKGPVHAKVTYASMADGTLYPAHQALDLKAQSLKIDVENSGYTK